MSNKHDSGPPLPQMNLDVPCLPIQRLRVPHLAEPASRFRIQAAQRRQRRPLHDLHTGAEGLQNSGCQEEASKEELAREQSDPAPLDLDEGLWREHRAIDEGTLRVFPEARVTGAQSMSSKLSNFTQIFFSSLLPQGVQRRYIYQKKNEGVRTYKFVSDFAMFAMTFWTFCSWASGPGAAVLMKSPSSE